MDSQAAFIDRDTGPDPRHQIVFADDLARLFGQDDENVEGTPAEMKRHPQVIEAYLGEVAAPAGTVEAEA